MRTQQQPLNLIALLFSPSGLFIMLSKLLGQVNLKRVNGFELIGGEVGGRDHFKNTGGSTEPPWVLLH